MCGIAACCDKSDPGAFLGEALRRLQYRGYDSWGAVVLSSGSYSLIREEGPPDQAASKLGGLIGSSGLAHTRWATHGRACPRNAHPVRGGVPGEEFFVVHNGVVENFARLKESLGSYKFKTDTDTEVIAHMLHRESAGGVPLHEAAAAVLGKLRGANVFAAASMAEPWTIAVATSRPPAFLGLVGHAASDAHALDGFEEKCFRLRPGTVASWQKGQWRVYDSGRDDWPQYFSVPKRPWSAGGMLDEILQQPELLAEPPELPHRLLIRRASVTAYGCGSSFHACLAAADYFRGVSDYKACRPDEITPAELQVAVSQSGETADVLDPLGFYTNMTWSGLLAAVTNAPHSSLAGAADFSIDLNLGPELSVAATKSFTASALALQGLACQWAGRDRRELYLDASRSAAWAVSQSSRAEELARRLTDRAFILAEANQMAAAMEWALKLKEVAGIWAEALPISELKHGPLALVDDKISCVFLVPTIRGETTVAEARSRGGQVACLSERPIDCDFRVGLEHCDLISLSVLGQLVAFHAGNLRGLNVERPRNLAKCVTVN